tara:strand:+ start:696 stop:911 length:216 start_codon:yes stop_codon:yes gene_type:complete
MGIKAAAVKEMDSLMKEFDISPSRLGRDLFNNPNFYWNFVDEGKRTTDVTIDRIFAYAVELRGQLKLPLGD